MSLKDKYQSALDFAKEHGAEMENFHEEDGNIVFNGTVPTPFVRNAIWDKLKSINGLSKDDAAPSEVKANIKVSDDSVYHRHTVVAGETLGKIAKHYFDDASKYVAIFEANKDILKNPDLIVVGQVLSIPNP
ncbi:MAG TPA: LysM peptidoglycan-binding domain-containing protein [Haliscomenobacter sp.]|uniref:Peptidoglycan-binding lysin domain protein n=1 Tax=Haliscomenobacter hydrossis (strain ATCC 27775 / DSM 1100 / LMG 10767 / O) TaxID=760192 RepID=F4KPI6_HALH1|nr:MULTISPECIES: LysM peptidoglycan-binding domain-containing protein [Haliscomenobacter]AEE49940.1 Peptidoglycan-binding lysin domain protein [Haliscomenobacter hydrossis DSM 1100]HOY16796.1 LysM peptidoglycan-binding domain-containing protein [Haliscomenobacter sp.]HPH17407.1 LysM peptidoglycan-binding domain-containing protein [Haliscomenobacter sp.]